MFSLGVISELSPNFDYGEFVHVTKKELWTHSNEEVTARVVENGDAVGDVLPVLMSEHLQHPYRADTTSAFFTRREVMPRYFPFTGKMDKMGNVALAYPLETLVTCLALFTFGQFFFTSWFAYMSCYGIASLILASASENKEAFMGRIVEELTSTEYVFNPVTFNPDRPETFPKREKIAGNAQTSRRKYPMFHRAFRAFFLSQCVFVDPRTCGMDTVKDLSVVREV